MAYIKYILTISISLMTSLVNAETVFAGNSIWRSPIDNNVSLTLDSKPQVDLTKSCARFAILIENYKPWIEDENLVLEAKKMIDEVRLARGPGDRSSSNTFKVTFRIKESDSNFLSPQKKAEMRILSGNLATKDKFPLITQAPNAILLKDNSFSEIKVVGDNDSLTKKMATFGLLPAPVNIGQDVNGYYVVVNSLDTACDLTMQKASLTTKGMAVVQLSVDQQVLLKTFYNGPGGIAEIAANVLSRTSVAKRRAGLLGFKIGSYLHTGRPENLPKLAGANLEDGITYALDQLFTSDNLDRTEVWNSNSEVEISDLSNPVPVNIDIKNPPIR